MSKPLLRALIAFGLAVLASPSIAQTCTPTFPAGDLVAAGKLQLAINPTLPLQFVDSKGELQGLNVELGREIAKRLCLHLEFMRMDFPAMIPALRTGRFDGINTGMFWTEERSKLIYMVPYGLQAIDVVAVPSSKLKIASIEELAGRSVGLEVDTYQERWLRDFDKGNVGKGQAALQIRGFNNGADVMTALRAGQVEVAAMPNYMGREVVRRGQANLLIGGLGATPSAMAFRKRTVADAVANALTEMRRDGTYEKLFDEFGMTKLPEERFAIRGPGPE